MTSPEMLEEVNDYYEEAYLDYVLVWRTWSHGAMHFGYHDTDSPLRRWLRFGDAMHEVDRVLADEAEVGEDDRVVDLGCGVGGSVLRLAEERGADAVGVNVSAEHLGKARRKAVHRDVDDVDFVTMDFEDTGFDDGSFDVVWSVEAACHAEDTGRWAEEAYRLLEPGGRLVVGDGYLSKPMEKLDEDARRRLDVIDEAWVGGEVDTVDGFRQHLEAAGFEDVEFTDQYERVKPSAVYLWLASVLATPGAWVLEKLGFRGERQRRNRVAARHQYPVLRDGVVKHGLFTARKPD